MAVSMAHLLTVGSSSTEHCRHPILNFNVSLNLGTPLELTHFFMSIRAWESCADESKFSPQLGPCSQGCSEYCQGDRWGPRFPGVSAMCGHHMCCVQWMQIQEHMLFPLGILQTLLSPAFLWNWRGHLSQATYWYWLGFRPSYKQTVRPRPPEGRTVAVFPALHKFICRDAISDHVSALLTLSKTHGSLMDSL